MLGDYNTLVDKATLGHDINAIELDFEDLKAANERAEKSLEWYFEERKKKEAQLKTLELEIEQVLLLMLGLLQWFISDSYFLNSS